MSHRTHKTGKAGPLTKQFYKYGPSTQHYYEVKHWPAGAYQDTDSSCGRFLLGIVGVPGSRAPGCQPVELRGVNSSSKALVGEMKLRTTTGPLVLLCKQRKVC